MEDARDGGHDATSARSGKAARCRQRHADAHRCAGRVYRAEASLDESTDEHPSPTPRACSTRSEASNATPRSQASPGQILVVDDNASNRDLLTRQLARDGHAVEAAASGAEGLALREGPRLRPDPARRPDAGNERLRGSGPAEVRSATRAEIPVIMISALDEMEFDRALHRGRRGRLSPKAVRARAAARAHPCFAREQAAARPRARHDRRRFDSPRSATRRCC